MSQSAEREQIRPPRESQFYGEIDHPPPHYNHRIAHRHSHFAASTCQPYFHLPITSQQRMVAASEAPLPTTTPHKAHAAFGAATSHDQVAPTHERIQPPSITIRDSPCTDARRGIPGGGSPCTDPAIGSRSRHRFLFRPGVKDQRARAHRHGQTTHNGWSSVFLPHRTDRTHTGPGQSVRAPIPTIGNRLMRPAKA